MPPLTDLSPQDRAIIHEVRGRGALRKRLLDMGVIPGAEIAVVRVAPLGDPVEYLVKGYHLSLRRDEAAQIMVHTVTIGTGGKTDQNETLPGSARRWPGWLTRRRNGR
ncbi:MAG: ferrous iron transport protein A [Caldilineae bacterium]|nr:ferrous iron transport protein A [Anaerolineae bacterium]MCB0201449.1 ferrous iron transport protein A [Anaerolineae bacterium]MCB0205455.1 ferrous iron transport protein A [Anaerolineae bacterium]MCB0256660.1 ferrous iron transport protein A [Anaerolineae bacterium]MCB9155209.1 ferrous iron transport protein A [Caldilineae bacterium]